MKKNIGISMIIISLIIYLLLPYLSNSYKDGIISLYPMESEYNLLLIGIDLITLATVLFVFGMKLITKKD